MVITSVYIGNMCESPPKLKYITHSVPVTLHTFLYIYYGYKCDKHQIFKFLYHHHQA